MSNYIHPLFASTNQLFSLFAGEKFHTYVACLIAATASFLCI